MGYIDIGNEAIIGIPDDELLPHIPRDPNRPLPIFPINDVIVEPGVEPLPYMPNPDMPIDAGIPIDHIMPVDPEIGIPIERFPGIQPIPMPEPLIPGVEPIPMPTPGVNPIPMPSPGFEPIYPGESGGPVPMPVIDPIPGLDPIPMPEPFRPGVRPVPMPDPGRNFDPRFLGSERFPDVEL